jgi:hypothetical protein
MLVAENITDYTITRDQKKYIFIFVLLTI